MDLCVPIGANDLQILSDNRAEDGKFPDKNLRDAENSGSIDIGSFWAKNQ